MQRNYGRSYVPRGLIKFYQFLGTFFSVLILGITVYLLTSDGTIQSMDPSTQVLMALIVAIEVYMIWKSIYSAVVIINYMNKATDEEIIANRFILAVLSLGVGGFVTPFVLTSLPNVDSESSINPRAFLTKHLGLTMIVGFTIFLVSFILIAMNWTGMKFNELIDTNQEWGVTSFTTIIIGFVGALLGLLGYGLFARNNSAELMKQKNIQGYMMQVVAIIFTIIATVELVFLMIMSIIRLIGVIADSLNALQRNEGIMRFFAMMIALARIGLAVAYVGMMIQMCSKIISGLWTKDQVIRLNNFEKVDELKANQATN